MKNVLKRLEYIDNHNFCYFESKMANIIKYGSVNQINQIKSDSHVFWCTDSYESFNRESI